jgi:8-oxo-dGTP pyrophosphatase MutT (NUDIX family)
VLLRDGVAGLEVLLLVRGARGSDPFSGASVFPGGVVDPADEDERLVPSASRFDPERATRELGEKLPSALRRSLYVAACRELLEEAAILLARASDGHPPPADIVSSLDAERRLLQAGDRIFHALLDRTGLVLALDQLLPFAHWITPEGQRKRWDTRFFLAIAPEGQKAASDGTETTKAAWLSPRAALEAYRGGSILLAPPTFRVLEELDGYRDVEHAFEATRAKGPPTAILPVPLADAPVPTLLYPGDRQYPGQAAGEGLNRLVLEDGKWKSTVVIQA